jgi:hypothetical protein
MALSVGDLILGGLALLLLLSTPLVYRKARLQRTLRNNRLGWPEQLEQMSDPERRDLFGWATRLHPMNQQPPLLANAMRDLHEAVVSRRPGAMAWLLLFALYLAGFVAAAATMVLLFRHSAEQNSRAGSLLAGESLGAFREMAALRKQGAADERIEELREEQVAAFGGHPKGAQVRALDQLVRRAVNVHDIDEVDVQAVRFRLGLEEKPPPAGD